VYIYNTECEMMYRVIFSNILIDIAIMYGSRRYVFYYGRVFPCASCHWDYYSGIYFRYAYHCISVSVLR